MLHRKLLAHERGLFAQHLKRMPAPDRQFRFAHSRVDDQWIDKYVAGIAEGDMILGCFDDQAGDPVLIGAAHVAIANKVAEVGISVDPAFRTKGIGAELIRRAVRWTRNRNAEKLYTLCQSDNVSMIALARKLGMSVHREWGTAEAFLPLDPPDLLSVGDELSVDFDLLLRDWTRTLSVCQGALLPKWDVAPKD